MVEPGTEVNREDTAPALPNCPLGPVPCPVSPGIPWPVPASLSTSRCIAHFLRDLMPRLVLTPRPPARPVPSTRATLGQRPSNSQPRVIVETGEYQYNHGRKIVTRVTCAPGLPLWAGVSSSPWGGADVPASVWCHERGAMSRAVKGMGVALLTLVLIALCAWGVLAIYYSDLSSGSLKQRSRPFSASGIPRGLRVRAGCVALACGMRVPRNIPRRGGMVDHDRALERSRLAARGGQAALRDPGW